MKIKDLSGKEHNWTLGKYVGKTNNNCSKLHAQVRAVLKQEYPALQILEEVHIPGEKLYLDFYIPSLQTAIECQGGQHDKYTPFFHDTKLNFYKAKGRDRRKSSFCDLNDITLIYIYPDEDEEEWTRKLSEI